MGGIRFSFPACVIAGKGRIDRHDLLILRKYGFPDGILSYEDALLLLALNDMCPDHCDDWPAYFIEQLTAFVVDMAPPRGRLDPLKSAWLTRMLGVDGVIEHPLHLEVLLHAMERASDHAPLLSVFALDQLRHALSTNPAGAHARARPAAHGITDQDLAFVWRIFRQSVDNGRLFLSPQEASTLYMIDNLVRHRQNHPAWTDVMQHASGQDRPLITLRNSPWLVIRETLGSHRGNVLPLAERRQKPAAVMSENLAAG